MCIKVGWWNNTILRCTVEKISNYVLGLSDNLLENRYENVILIQHHAIKIFLAVSTQVSIRWKTQLIRKCIRIKIKLPSQIYCKCSTRNLISITWVACLMHAREHAGRLHTCCRFFIYRYVQRKNYINCSCRHLLFKQKTTLPGSVTHESFYFANYENTLPFLYWNQTATQCYSPLQSGR